MSLKGDQSHFSLGPDAVPFERGRVNPLGGPQFRPCVSAIKGAFLRRFR